MTKEKEHLASQFQAKESVNLLFLKTISSRQLIERIIVKLLSINNHKTQSKRLRQSR